MKKALQKRLQKIWDKAGEIQAELEAVQTEFAEYRDERSDKWHESEAGERADMDASELDDAVSNMQEVMACIDRIIVER